MKIGIICSWDLNTQRGKVISEDFAYEITYLNGKNIVSGSRMLEPRLGHHDQPDGFELKIPQVGDVVVFAATRSIAEWAYAEHYLTAATRKFPSEFRSA